MRLDRLLDADRQDRGLCARKQDVDQALLRKEGRKQFLGEPGGSVKNRSGRLTLERILWMTSSCRDSERS